MCVCVFEGEGDRQGVNDGLPFLPISLSLSLSPSLSLSHSLSLSLPISLSLSFFLSASTVSSRSISHIRKHVRPQLPWACLRCFACSSPPFPAGSSVSARACICVSVCAGTCRCACARACLTSVRGRCACVLAGCACTRALPVFAFACCHFVLIYVCAVSPL